MGGEQGESGKSIVLDRGLACGLVILGLVRLVYDGVYGKLIIAFSANSLPSCRPSIWVRADVMNPGLRGTSIVDTHDPWALAKRVIIALPRPSTRGATNTHTLIHTPIPTEST